MLALAGLCAPLSGPALAATPCDPCCPADLNEDGEVDGADLGLLLGAWDTDDRCADIVGDGLVDGADLGLLLGAWGPCPTKTLCVFCQNSDHDCCTTGSPGCTDVVCCETVCTDDPFCCDSLWDELCVGAATRLCEDLCLPCPDSDHDCCTPGSPGCTDPACCSTVCAADPFCCDVFWDDICVNSAEKLCAIACGPCPPSDHGCFTTGGPGCNNVACCNLVCGVDPFCCQSTWDIFCVQQALRLCVPAGW